MKRPLGYEVKTLARMMKQRIDDTEFMRTNEQMTGMQGWVLGYFTRHDGEDIFQRDLEAEFRVRRSTMTQLLNTMESRGLIERVECEKDRRLKKIVPTTLAREYMERSIEAINEAEAQLTQGFSQQELETLRVIECLKKAGLEIKDIKQFIQWCTQGASTYQKRYDLFVKQRAAMEAQIEHMQRILDMIHYKCWYYETALKEGNEERLKNLSPAEMPEEIRRAYQNAHTP